MEDFQIIELYWRRNEQAIEETDRKYGKFCHRLAVDILGLREDAEECVSDTYLKAWTAIPPQRPQNFMAWLGRVVRNTAINYFDRKHAKKRYDCLEGLLSELDDCIPDTRTPEKAVEAEELGKIISRWLRSISAKERTAFVRRYWYAQPLKDIAREEGVSPAKLARRMYDLRIRLKEELEKEGIYL